MHVSIIITALLSAGALALPATNSTSSTLEKRVWKHGWIGTYAPEDLQCKGKQTEGKNSGRPKFKPNEKCTKLRRDPSTNIEIFWGEGNYHNNEVHVFYDEDCKDYAKVIPQPKGDPKTCYDFVADNRPWKSTKAVWNYDLP